MVFELRDLSVASTERSLGRTQESLAGRRRLLVLETQHKVLVRHDSGAWDAGDVAVIVNVILTVAQHGNGGGSDGVTKTMPMGDEIDKLWVNDSLNYRISRLASRAVIVKCGLIVFG